MKLQRLLLENIMCFPHRTIDFDDLTIIHGENRTGKSTTVYSLYHVLFGKHLNEELSSRDLLRHGEKNGSLALFFKLEDNTFQLRRTPSGNQPTLSKIPFDSPDVWADRDGDIEDIDSEKINDYIKIPSEIAALTSFFREGELTYFGKNISKPKYGKNLLEMLLEVDEIKITRSKFKRALDFAEDTKRQIEKDRPEGKTDENLLKTRREQIAETEKKLETVQSEYEKLLEYGNKDIDPTVFRMLKEDHDRTEKERNQKQAERDKLPPIADIEKEKERLEKLPGVDEEKKKRKGELERRLIQLSEQAKNLEREINKYQGLQNKPACPVCTQSVTNEWLQRLIREKEEKTREVMKEQQKVDTERVELNKLEQTEVENKKALEKISKELERVKRLEKQIKELNDHLAKTKEDLKQFEQVKEMTDIEKQHRRRKELKEEQEKLMNHINLSKVKLANMEREIERGKEFKEKIEKATKNWQLCKVTYRALDNAFRRLGDDLLRRVRDNLPRWKNAFEFLKGFDIDLKPGELSFLINAKDYDVKLAQMSKSERTFLYIMLKLVMGDALGHLGVFILDDPADGLDRTQKRTLADFLTRLSLKRQVIITTNDSDFAALFETGARIDL